MRVASSHRPTSHCNDNVALLSDRETAALALSLVGLPALEQILHHEIKQTVCLLSRTLNDMSPELDALNQELSS